jgi:phospholipid/cholesterol/gamma-HCH transport system ATP-binding protein
MIEINNIAKAFNGKEVLKGISSKFEKGQTNLIIGGSGTGKSVLLKCMIGLVKPDGGNVLYNGRDFYNCDKETQQSIRREMGVLFQGGAFSIPKPLNRMFVFPWTCSPTRLCRKSRSGWLFVCSA